MPDRNLKALFREQTEAKGLAVPDDLQADIDRLLTFPISSADVLRERVMKGVHVLIRRGGQDAPDHLWERFDALLTAWVICEWERDRFGLNERREIETRDKRKPEPVQLVFDR